MYEKQLKKANDINRRGAYINNQDEVAQLFDKVGQFDGNNYAQELDNMNI